jgi:hypothetical protein
MTARHRFLMLRKAGLFSGLMVALSCAAACTDSGITLQVAYLSDRSDWYEFDVSGRQLVHESGTLTGSELAAAYQCDRWQLAAQITTPSGLRLYDGQTNTGSPVVSHSDIQQQLGQFQASFSLTPQWQIGSRWTYQSMARDIASAGGASGYPERFEWNLLSVGAQWQADVGPGQLTVAAWLGQQVQSSMHITLPGRDPTVLPLGPIRQVDWTAGWRMPLSQAWHVQADVGYRRTEIGEGAETIITRNGVPVGVAHQPRSVLVSRPISIRLGYAF